MAKKSKGVKRLAIVSGFISTITLFILLNKVLPSPKGYAVFLAFFGYPIGFYLIGWSIVKISYWVYCGFKEDRNNK